jgi:hypothetical protein
LKIENRRVQADFGPERFDAASAWHELIVKNDRKECKEVGSLLDLQDSTIRLGQTEILASNSGRNFKFQDCS